MPWVTIKTGTMSANGEEQILREYLCDRPGCANVAEHVLGVVRDVAMMHAVCPEHAEVPKDRPTDSGNL
jgi:hypothetical protein